MYVFVCGGMVFVHTCQSTSLMYPATSTNSPADRIIAYVCNIFSIPDISSFCTFREINAPAQLPGNIDPDEGSYVVVCVAVGWCL